MTWSEFQQVSDFPSKRYFLPYCFVSLLRVLLTRHVYWCSPPQRIGVRLALMDGNILLKVESRLNKTIRGVPPNNLLKISNEDNLFLLGHTDSLALVAGGLGVLAPDPEAPVVTETTVGADLLEALEVLTELVVEEISQNLGCLAVLGVALPVEEPVGDLVLAGILQEKKMITQ